MLPIIANNQTLTMSSREIAELTEKEHKTVMRDIRVMLKNLGHGTDLYLGKYSSNNREYDEYNLPKRETLLLISGYMLHVRAKIIDRLDELERALLCQSTKLPDFSNPAEAARAWADQFEQNQANRKQLELQAPKVAFVDKLVDKGNLMTATQVAQKHGKSAKWLNAKLVEHDVYSKAVKRSKVFRQWFIDKGYGENKQSEAGFDQSLFTNAGEIWINELLIAHGYI